MRHTSSRRKIQESFSREADDVVSLLAAQSVPIAEEMQKTK
jgi:hypothetical protein